jgi:cellulose synthase/poly-beta-1,6-N-acetylglucosamine synthase-like glycosyltransferase
MAEKMHVSVGVFAYREGGNVEACLRSLIAQHSGKIVIDEVIVVWDGLEPAQAEAAEFIKGKNIRLVISQERQGKFAAINRFLAMAASDVLVMVSADVVLDAGAVEALCKPFLDGRVGMAGGRPVPANDPDTFFGHMAHLQWQLHHALSLHAPKFGELVAFRRVFENLPPTLVDEEEIAAIVKGKGFLLRYVPEACVHNKGVENLGDFFKQRRRVYAGHLDLKQRRGYAASTLNGLVVAGYLLKDIRSYSQRPGWLLMAVILESAARALGWFDFSFKGRTYAWPMAESTKSLHA